MCDVGIVVFFVEQNVWRVFEIVDIGCVFDFGWVYILGLVFELFVDFIFVVLYLGGKFFVVDVG